MLIQSSCFLIMLESIIIYNFNFSYLEKSPVMRPIFITQGYSFLPSAPSHIDTHVSEILSVSSPEKGFSHTATL